MQSRRAFLKSRRLSLATVWLLGCVFGTCIPSLAAVAASPSSANLPKDGVFSNEVKKLVEDAKRAQTAGDLGLALVQLKNAVRLNPKNGEIRAYLGIALLKSGDTRIAERELRDAWTANAPEEIVIPALLDAMVVRGEATQLLAEFPEPLTARQAKIAPDILRQRALALQVIGRSTEANETMERSLALRRDPRALTARAKLAVEQGDLALAGRVIDEAVRLSPKDEDVLVSRVVLFFQTGNLDKALAAADDFVRRLPLSIIARVMRIEVLLARKEDALARAELDAILAQAPDSSFGPYYGGVIAARANDFQSAWHQEQTLQPEFVLSRPGTAMMVAEIAIANGNVASGAAILAALVSRRPEYVAGRIRLAGVLLALRNPQAAAETLEPIKTRDDLQVQAILGQAYTQLGRYAEAVGALEKAISFNKTGNNDLLKQQLAQSSYELGDSDRAARDLRELEAKQPGKWDIVLPLMASLTQAGKFDEALAAIGRIPKKTPGDAVLISFYRGRVLAVEGDLPAAEAAFTEALATDPKFIPALYFRGHVFVARGNSEAGKKAFREILAINPANTSAYVALAQIAVHEGHAAESTALLNTAVKASPNDAAPRLALAALQISRREFDDARATLDALLRISPDNAQALAQLGQIQFATRQDDRAVETYRSLAAAYPTSPSTYVLLARALNAKKDRLAAIDAARRAVELAPHSLQTRTVLIEYLIAGNRPDEALASAHDYALAHPGAEGDLLVTNTLTRLNRADEANKFLASRFSANPNRLLAQQMSGNALAAGDRKKAAAILVDWLKRSPQDFDIRLQYASLLSQSGETLSARKELEALLKQRPEDPTILNNLGWNLRDDDPDRAISLVSLAVKVAPDAAPIMDTLGWLKFLRRSDLQGALVLLRRAHELAPVNGSIGYHLAVALEGTGRRAEAKAVLQSVIDKDMKFSERNSATQLLARL